MSKHKILKFVGALFVVVGLSFLLPGPALFHARVISISGRLFVGPAGASSFVGPPFHFSGDTLLRAIGAVVSVTGVIMLVFTPRRAHRISS